jgi:hypothetical protein
MHFLNLPRAVVCTLGLVAVAGCKSTEDPVAHTACGGPATAMVIGQVITNLGPAGFCGYDEDAGEYAVIAFDSSLSASSFASFEMLGTDIGSDQTSVAFRSLSAGASRAVTGISGGGSIDLRRRDDAGEARFLDEERATLSPLVPAAQEWYRNRPRAAVRDVVTPAVGDTLSLILNMGSSCLPSPTGKFRVAVISDRTIILDDVTNPSGGFTDADYTAFAATFDTLVDPLDTQTFGESTDLDNNGRVMILFTRALNELTPRGSMTFTAGRTLSRDLFPKTTTGGKTGCAASNVGEMFYMMVPDPNGEVNGNQFSKEDVDALSVATIAHEYQHLINFSRRMYLLGLPASQWFDESWLHEGLSHMAEELLFHRASGFEPRTNIGLDMLSTSDQAIDDFNLYMLGDFSIYDSYALTTTTNSPFGDVDQVGTRGGIWAFLRYAADQIGTSDGDLWYRLVNSGLIGLPNLETALGVSKSGLQSMLRDFAISVYADDFVPGVASKYSQPSWNMRSIYAGFPDPSFVFPLDATPLTDGVPEAATVVGSGFKVFLFHSKPGTANHVRATGPDGGTVPPAITLSIIRIG